MAEYDGNEDLLCWRIGTFGHKTKDGSTISSYYYIKDHLGNIRVTVNDEGTIVTKDDYYPFGLRMGGMSYNAGNANDRLKYSGKELDEGMGMSKYHFGWRDYDPEIGRWHVKDPLYWLTPGKTPYNYCSNDPVNRIDIFGLGEYPPWYTDVGWNRGGGPLICNLNDGGISFDQPDFSPMNVNVDMDYPSEVALIDDVSDIPPDELERQRKQQLFDETMRDLDNIFIERINSETIGGYNGGSVPHTGGGSSGAPSDRTNVKPQRHINEMGPKIVSAGPKMVYCRMPDIATWITPGPVKGINTVKGIKLTKLFRWHKHNFTPLRGMAKKYAIFDIEGKLVKGTVKLWHINIGKSLHIFNPFNPKTRLITGSKYKFWRFF